MAKKMCKEYHSMGFCEWNGKMRCPSNTNSRCEIVKPKAKVRRVKAWASVYNGAIETISTNRVFGRKPCTVLIDEKYLKEKR